MGKALETGKGLVSWPNKSGHLATDSKLLTLFGVPKDSELEPDYLLAKRDGNSTSKRGMIPETPHKKGSTSHYHLSRRLLELRLID
jgi:hypothetical protein